MATSGKPLPPEDRRRIVRMIECGVSIRAASREMAVSRNTVRKIVRTAIPK